MGSRAPASHSEHDGAAANAASGVAFTPKPWREHWDQLPHRKQPPAWAVTE